MKISTCKTAYKVSCCKLVRYKVIFTEIEMVNSDTMSY